MTKVERMGKTGGRLHWPTLTLPWEALSEGNFRTARDAMAAIRRRSKPRPKRRQIRLIPSNLARYIYDLLIADLGDISNITITLAELFEGDCAFPQWAGIGNHEEG